MKNVVYMLLFLTIFLPGCITINHKINDDGTSSIEQIYDLEFLLEKIDEDTDLTSEEKELQKLDLKKSVQELCDNFKPENYNFHNAQCRVEGYKSIISGELDLVRSGLLDIKVDGKYTEYNYKVTQVLVEVFELNPSESEDFINEDISLEYIVEMPGEIFELDIGTIEGNKVHITIDDMKSLEISDTIKSRKKQSGNLNYFYIGSAIFVIIGALFFLLRKKEKPILQA